MEKENLFEKATLLKERFTTLFQQKKKVKALENYSEAEPVVYREELKLIKLCMTNRFLSRKGAEFLEELLDEHQLSYLEWAHRTKWLKAQIAGKRSKRAALQQTFFDFETKTLNMPINLINPAKASQLMRV